MRKPLWRLSYQQRLRLLLLPYLSGILLLVALPALLSFGLAFFRYDALSPPTWIGNLNFLLATTDELFLLSIQNSLALVILPVPLRVLGAFLLAILLRRNGRFLGWFRAAVYLPSIIPAAAYALAWLWILNPLFGPVNLLLQAVGTTAARLVCRCPMGQTGSSAALPVANWRRLSGEPRRPARHS